MPDEVDGRVERVKFIIECEECGHATSVPEIAESRAKLALVDDAIQRVAFVDDSGQPVIQAHERMHRHHADEPYMGCVFCRDQFVSLSAVSELREAAWGQLDATDRFAHHDAVYAAQKRLRAALARFHNEGETK